jgi:hypothetical protein
MIATPAPAPDLAADVGDVVKAESTRAGRPLKAGDVALITCLLRSPTNTAAALLCGCSREHVSRRLKDPAFAAALRLAQDVFLDESGRLTAWQATLDASPVAVALAREAWTALRLRARVEELLAKAEWAA